MICLLTRQAYLNIEYKIEMLVSYANICKSYLFICYNSCNGYAILLINGYSIECNGPHTERDFSVNTNGSCSCLLITH